MFNISCEFMTDKFWELCRKTFCSDCVLYKDEKSFKNQKTKEIQLKLGKVLILRKEKVC